MMMLRKAKCLCDQLKGKLGLVAVVGSGVSGSSIVGLNPPFIYQCRRLYFLPPPPSERVVDFPTTQGIHCVDNAETNYNVVKSAKFAVRVQNKVSSSQEGGDTIQFGRVLRASRWCGVFGTRYYITLEALRGKADMNVYYAEIVDGRVPFQQPQMEMDRWELVNESFCYPFEEIRQSSYFGRKMRRERVAAKNILMSKWLDEMELQCREAEVTKWIPRVDKLDSINLERCEMLNGEIFSPTSLKIDDFQVVETVFDIKTYEMVYEYALFAVTTHNTNEDDITHLENVLWACKCKVKGNWIYRLILEATNGKNKLESYYAIIKVGPDKHFELIKWYLIPREFGNSGEEAGIIDLENFLEPGPEPSWESRYFLDETPNFAPLDRI